MTLSDNYFSFGHWVFDLLFELKVWLLKKLKNYLTLCVRYYDEMPCMLIEKVFYEYAAVAMTFDSNLGSGAWQWIWSQAY